MKKMNFETILMCLNRYLFYESIVITIFFQKKLLIKIKTVKQN